MGTEKERKLGSDPRSTPKLALHSFPSKAQDSPGTLTPPMQTLASVPFQWEEAPGRPRRGVGAGDGGRGAGDCKPKVARCLELPPRLLMTDQARVSNMPSPTTVLDDGPYAGRSLGRSLSFRKGGSFRVPVPESLGMKRNQVNKERVLFGSSRWGGVKKNKEVIGGGFDFLFSEGGGSCSTGTGGGSSSDGTKVKITRVSKRSVSFLSLSLPRSKSQFLTSIYESFKQAVPLPWSRHRRDKLREIGTSSSYFIN